VLSHLFPTFAIEFKLCSLKRIIRTPLSIFKTFLKSFIDAQSKLLKKGTDSEESPCQCVSKEKLNSSWLREVNIIDAGIIFQEVQIIFAA